MTTSSIMLAALRTYMGSRYSPHTLDNTLGQAERFLAKSGAHPAYSREQLLAYMDYLVGAGYKPRSIQVILSGVHTLFVANRIEWPLDKRDTHLGLPAGEELAPVLSPEDVARLIAGARRERGRDAVAVALATTWGLRATEMAAVFGAGLDGKELVVQSAKGGEVRRHTIPPELRPLLQFRPYPITRDGLHKAFDRMMSRHVRPPQEQEGWHAVRRSLVTELVTVGVEERLIHRWMGWHVAGITYRYWRPTPAQVDAAVYPRHPFLPFWSKR